MADLVRFDPFGSIRFRSLVLDTVFDTRLLGFPLRASPFACLILVPLPSRLSLQCRRQAPSSYCFF